MLSDHIEQVRCLLKLLDETEVTLKLKNCKLFAETTSYSGHAFQPSRSKLEKHLTKAVATLENPTIQTELHSFSGLCKVFRWVFLDFCRSRCSCQ